MTATTDNSQYVVRLWDGFDMEWFDVHGPCSKAEAEKVCKRRNMKAHGRPDGNYNDIDYCAVYPADTTMTFSRQGIGSQKGA